MTDVAAMIAQDPTPIDVDVYGVETSSTRGGRIWAIAETSSGALFSVYGAKKPVIGTPYFYFDKSSTLTRSLDETTAMQMHTRIQQKQSRGFRVLGEYRLSLRNGVIYGQRTDLFCQSEGDAARRAARRATFGGGSAKRGIGEVSKLLATAGAALEVGVYGVATGTAAGRIWAIGRAFGGGLFTLSADDIPVPRASGFVFTRASVLGNRLPPGQFDNQIEQKTSQGYALLGRYRLSLENGFVHGQRIDLVDERKPLDGLPRTLDIAQGDQWFV